jgi:putative nucleotidyltransferase with HDIG domain/PAS domain S-box-containing protein
MTAENIPYLIPYIIAFLLSATITAIIWRRRKVIGARLYAGVALGQTSIILGYIFELASTSLEGKIFWDDFQWVGLMAWAYLIPIFSLQITGNPWAKKRITWWLLAIVPVTVLILVLTNPLHGWMRQEAWLEYGNHFNSLRYEFTPLIWGIAAYGYPTMLLAFAYLMIQYFQSHRIYQFQIGAVVIGSGIPLVGYALSLMEVTLTFQRDIAPLTLTLGNLVVFWGLTRQRLFDLIPIARDIVVDNIDDIVIVVDAMDRVVDLNKAAREVFTANGSSAVGQNAAEFFSAFDDAIIQMGEIEEEGQTEVVLELGGEKIYIDMRNTRVRDRGQDIGRVFVARNVTAQKQFEQEILLLNTELEQRVAERTAELETAYESTLEGWAKALELRDKETEGHSRRVTELTEKLCGVLGIAPADVVNIRRGALIHDIGKMGIPNEILHKPGPLTPKEWEVMKQHPEIGYNLLAHIPFLEKALEITYCHHEKWNGTGYPQQIKGEEIPFSARIFTVIDHWDALLSDRPYRKAWEPERVIDYMQENRGQIFDPAILDAFFEMMGFKM